MRVMILKRMVLFIALQDAIKEPQRLRSRLPFTGVLRGPGRKVPPGVLFERSWAPGSECPKERFLSVFWHLLGSKGAKSTQKALKRHSGALGVSEPGAQKRSKSISKS